LEDTDNINRTVIQDEEHPEGRKVLM